MSSIAQEIIAAIQSRLMDIDGTGSYNTTAGDFIALSWQKIDPENVPCIFVLPGEESATASSGDGVPSGATSAMRIAWDIAVEGHVAANQSNTGEQLEMVKADIKRAMLRYTEPSLVNTVGKKLGVVGYLGSTPAPREEGAITESVQCRFRITYTEKYGDPDAYR